MVAPFKVGGLPAAPACALHKLRWGSDPLFTQENTEDKEAESDWNYSKYNESSISVKYTKYCEESKRLVSDEITLIEYIERFYGSKDKMLENEIMVVTRIFNDRVKSFIKNIMMTTNNDRIPFEFYSYRIEFQVSKTILQL